MKVKCGRYACRKVIRERLEEGREEEREGEGDMDSVGGNDDNMMEKIGRY